MPNYQYHCSGCDMLWETFQTIDENIADPPTHCAKCDPDEERPGTIYKYLGNSRPAFNLKGDGFYKPGWQ
jgi:predicted nucleic acid-binding Zn ribbon protein